MQSASAVVRFIYFTVTQFIGGGFNFIFIRSIFQYYMICVIYGTLYESQRYLKMTSLYCTGVLLFVYLRSKVTLHCLFIYLFRISVRGI